MKNIIEIRSYQLKPGTGSEFHQLLHEKSLPLLATAGIDVVLATASLQTPDTYMLVRAYQSVLHCEQSQQAFYASDAWQNGPRAAILACIASCNTMVLAADATLIKSLRHHP
ncbi:hypothetical protein A5320_19005 [Rheinheimera sp. SA_1]|uniref:NIPSNAP family protein n=1 Tax=Rheinheimera sp. SA_1 TaxID=1827365 RepID=UPI0007FBFC54|nr:NIPSNAP family protein [Rheinheimera sp. SA_1]OBP13396.1 hypothetical protein A5320_19005 [Rheinheimera sp. SA_1]